MTDTNTLQQRENRIVEMERRHKEDLRKLKANHDKLEARFICSHNDEHSAHTLPERTQGESHTPRIVNNQDDPSLSHIHRPTGWTTHWHPFVDHIMEANIPLG